MTALLDRYSAFIIDLDGVVYLLNDPIPGSIGVVEALQAGGTPFVFLTNNSSLTAEQYTKKLAGMGLRVGPENIVTAGQAVGRYLELEHRTDGRTAFVIGEDGLVAEVAGSGLGILSGGEARGADFVIVGWDRSFDFEKLKAAVIAIRNGAKYVATNADATYPTPEGLWPGAGAIVAAVTTGAGVEPVVVGKPNPFMVQLALERLGVGAREALLIGDRLDTDIETGLAAGVDTMLVLTGVSLPEDVANSSVKPTYIGSSLKALLELQCSIP